MVLVDKLHVLAYMPTKLWNKQKKLILYDTQSLLGMAKTPHSCLTLETLPQSILLLWGL